MNQTQGSSLGTSGLFWGEGSSQKLREQPGSGLFQSQPGRPPSGPSWELGNQTHCCDANIRTELSSPKEFRVKDHLGLGGKGILENVVCQNRSSIYTEFESTWHIRTRTWPSPALPASGEARGPPRAGRGAGRRVAGRSGHRWRFRGAARHTPSSSKGKPVIPSEDVFQLAGVGPEDRGAGRKGRGWRGRRGPKGLE